MKRFVLAVLAAVLAAWLASYIPAVERFWAWVWAGANAVWGWGWQTTPIWNFAAYGIGMLLVFAVIAKFASILTSTKEPSWMAYREDEFNGVVWRWRYINGSLSKPIPYCAVCDMVVVHSERDSEFNYLGTSTTLHCENCNEANVLTVEMSYSELKESVCRLVDRKIRVGEWENSVKQREMH